MLSSGVRPEQSFYDSVKKQETEKTNMYRLNQVAIRMVEMPPLLSAGYRVPETLRGK